MVTKKMLDEHILLIKWIGRRRDELERELEELGQIYQRTLLDASVAVGLPNSPEVIFHNNSYTFTQPEVTDGK